MRQWVLVLLFGLVAATAAGAYVAWGARAHDPPVPIPREVVAAQARAVRDAAEAAGWSLVAEARREVRGLRPTRVEGIDFAVEPGDCVGIVVSAHGQLAVRRIDLLDLDPDPEGALGGWGTRPQRHAPRSVSAAARCYRRPRDRGASIWISALDESSRVPSEGVVEIAVYRMRRPAEGPDPAIAPGADIEASSVRKGDYAYSGERGLGVAGKVFAGWVALLGAALGLVGKPRSSTPTDGS